MAFVPLKVVGSCVMDDETLFGHMEAAVARGFPEVTEQLPIRDGVVALVASGPSVAGELNVIREMQAIGTPIVAVKDAHDWLIGKGVIPDFALAIDPQEHRWNCFKAKHPDVQYMIASQCHAAMFDHLEGHKVTIWHPYIMKGQKRPRGRMTIGGGTTSGLRAISLFYVLGYRHFALFGFDSCLKGGMLRVNGDAPKQEVNEVRIEPDGEAFYCTPSMALQAQHFQNHYDWMPDATFYPFGDGLIQSIIRKRDQNAAALADIQARPAKPNDRVSFIHSGDLSVASYRYRAAIPASQIDASVNDLTADTLIFAKPSPQELWEMAKAKARGARVIVDFCDDHFDWTHYQEALRLADDVTCPTEAMAKVIEEHGKPALVIPDPYEYRELQPHCKGTNLLWFGHAVNRDGLARVMPEIAEYPLLVISNFPGSITWSERTVLQALANADIVILPKTDDYKSPNRALEAIRQGCFVVAEPHPALNDIPGIWIGNIKEGIEWARWNLPLANDRTLAAQKYVRERYSPPTVGCAWRRLIQSPSTSAAGKSTGTDG